MDALFRQLAPGAQMQAHWNLLRYTVPDARQVQQQFLCSKAKELQVINACVASSAAP
ncbi:putative secreted protein [Xanthomonas fragariae]|nr:putative secreted protein [Xanthomonas fragariae]